MEDQEKDLAIREAAFLTEIEQLEKEKGPKAVERMLNNFWLKFVNADTEGSARHSMVDGHEEDKTLAELSNEPETDAKHFSDQYINQTRKNYFDTLDQVASQLGLLELIQQAVSDRVEAQNKLVNVLPGEKRLSQEESLKFQQQFDESRHKISTALPKIYARLRAMGYQQWDLTV